MWHVGYKSSLGYHLAIEPATDTSCFGVIVLELYGCFAAGDTLEEALSNADESIALWLEYAHRRGKIIIPSPSNRLSVLFDGLKDKPEIAFSDNEINTITTACWAGQEISLPTKTH